MQADVCHAGLLQAVFEQHQPDVVMHLAAESHVDRSIDGPAEFIQTNLVGTATLLEVARAYWKALQVASPAKANGFRFHHISTDEVYGDLEGPEGRFTETTPTRPAPLFRQQGGLRPPGSRLAAHLRPAHAHHQLQQQLRAASVS